jgi:hypothetical protein
MGYGHGIKDFRLSAVEDSEHGGNPMMIEALLVNPCNNRFWMARVLARSKTIVP